MAETEQTVWARAKDVLRERGWCSAPTFNPDARCDACMARVAADLEGCSE